MDKSKSCNTDIYQATSDYDNFKELLANRVRLEVI